MYILNGKTSSLAKWIRDEIVLLKTVKRGHRGMAVQRVQEWLTFHGISLVIDGDFGPVTEDCVEEFQKKKKLSVTGTVNKDTYALLVKPMTDVLRIKKSGSQSLGAAVSRIAQQHLKQHPVEIGGDNCGPWVRLYMKGNEGRQWLWCAGFVTFILKQACEALGINAPIKGSFSCDTLAAQAKSAGLFVRERDVTPGNIPAGAIFLVRRTSTDWTHTGIVTSSNARSFSTVEGNTNDDGNRNGYEVCARKRGYRKRDFIVV